MYGKHVAPTFNDRDYTVLKAMEVTVRVPEDFEEAENCFLGITQLFRD